MKVSTYTSRIFFLVTIICGLTAWGQEQEATLETSVSLKPPRAQKSYLASLNYSVVDFPIPSKLGVTVGLISSPTQTWELEYMRGSISVPGHFRDLGSMTDTRIGFIGRTYFGESFHMSYGISYFDFSATVGDALLNNLTGGGYPNIDMLTVQGFGLNVGLGNTWVINKNITLGIDWLTIAQPLVVTKKNSDYVNYTSNKNDKKNVEDTMKIVSYLPRFAAASVHVGVLF